MKEGTHVRISKQWHSPEITIVVNDAGLAINMPLTDFIAAVSQEYGNPAATLTRAQHLSRLYVAASTVTESMKRETTAVA